MRSNRVLNDPLVMVSSGPASETDAGATRSARGAPVNVSATLKKLPPDCASLPVTVELVSWISGDAVVEDSCPPCATKKAVQQAAGEVEKEAPKPSEVKLKVLFVAERSGPESVNRVGLAAEDRRTSTMPPAVSRLLFVKLM